VREGAKAWALVELGDLVRVRRQRVDPQEYPEMPFIGMENVEAHTMRLLGTIPAGTMRSAATHYVPGDVLYGRLRPYLNKVISPPFEGLASAEFIPLTPEPGVSTHFIRYRLNAADFVSFTSHLDEGDRPRVDFDGISTFNISLPPSAEQRRIVEAIDSYITRLDDAVASLERVQAKLKRYRASVLKAAVEGRLVPTEAAIARAEKRDYESAEDLLTRILEERRRRWQEAGGRGKYKEPVSVDQDTSPVLPEGWTWASLDQLTSLITSGSRGWAEYYAEEGAIFIRAQDIKTDALVAAKLAHVSPPKGAEGARTSVQLLDLLVTITGANVTKAALVEYSLGEAYVSQHVGLCRPVLSESCRYLHLYTVCPSAGRRYLEKAAYGAGKPGLNLDNLRELVVALPPLKEQTRIVEQCAALLSVNDNLDEVVRVNIRRASRLRQAVLKWAFEGKLADQDASEDPAEELVTRIRSQRASESGSTPRRKGKAKGAP